MDDLNLTAGQQVHTQDTVGGVTSAPNKALPVQKPSINLIHDTVQEAEELLAEIEAVLRTKYEAVTGDIRDTVKSAESNVKTSLHETAQRVRAAANRVLWLAHNL